MRTIFSVERIEGGQLLIYTNPYKDNVIVGITEDDSYREDKTVLKPGHSIGIYVKKIYILVE